MKKRTHVEYIPPMPQETPDSKKLRVAAYCRVSTNQEEQQHSYQAQCEYYTKKIAENPAWTMAGIFADRGITGTSAEKRPEFMRMIRWCKKGKIDLVLTKSISRFSRNTIQCLEYIRQLRELKIPVIFEEDDLNTLLAESELMIALKGAFAQAESEQISKRVKWGVRQPFSKGVVRYNFNTWYGYRRGADGAPEIIPEEAAVIRKIYDLYLQGLSVGMIQRRLTEDGIATRANRPWSPSAICNALRNEKYAGDALLQKTYVTDCISKKVRRNCGELPQYMVKNCHKAIIERKTYEAVQAEIRRRSGLKNKPQNQTRHYSGKYALTGLMFCGECGAAYKRVTWARNGKKKIVWRCSERLKNGTEHCKNSPSIVETDLKRILVDAIEDALQQNKDLMRIYQQKVWPKLEETERCDWFHSRKRIHELDQAILALAETAAQSGKPELFDAHFSELIQEQKELEMQTKGSTTDIGCQAELFTLFDLAVRTLVDKIMVGSSMQVQISFVDGQYRKVNV